MHLFCGNGSWVIPFYVPKKTVQTCQGKTGENEPILYFWQQFLFPPTPNILIKHNAKEDTDKGNILCEFYIPEVEVSGGVQRRLSGSQSDSSNVNSKNGICISNFLRDVTNGLDLKFDQKSETHVTNRLDSKCDKKK